MKNPTEEKNPTQSELMKTIELLAKAVTAQGDQIKAIAESSAKTTRGKAVPEVDIEGLNAKQRTSLTASIKRAMSKVKYKNFDLKAERVVKGTDVQPAMVKQLKKDGSYSEFEVKSTRAIVGIYDKEGNKIRESTWHV